LLIKDELILFGAVHVKITFNSTEVAVRFVGALTVLYVIESLRKISKYPFANTAFGNSASLIVSLTLKTLKYPLVNAALGNSLSLTVSVLSALRNPFAKLNGLIGTAAAGVLVGVGVILVVSVGVEVVVGVGVAGILLEVGVIVGVELVVVVGVTAMVLEVGVLVIVVVGVVVGVCVSVLVGVGVDVSVGVLVGVLVAVGVGVAVSRHSIVRVPGTEVLGGRQTESFVALSPYMTIFMALPGVQPARPTISATIEVTFIDNSTPLALGSGARTTADVLPDVLLAA
jgi:hypothetical protein